MKFVKTIGILLFIALLASTAAATTENKDMPTEKEVTNFTHNFKASDDFANSAYNAFIEQFPAGHCDIWSDGMISFYYYAPDSPKEYGAIYLDSTGKEAKMSCRAGITPVKSYKGEAITKVTEDTITEVINVSDEQGEVKEDAPKEVPEVTENKEVTEEKEVTADQKAPEEVKEETENTTVPEVKEDASDVKETNDDKIQSVIKFFKTGDMDAESLEKCLYHYFGED